MYLTYFLGLAESVLMLFFWYSRNVMIVNLVSWFFRNVKGGLQSVLFVQITVKYVPKVSQFYLILRHKIEMNVLIVPIMGKISKFALFSSNLAPIPMLDCSSCIEIKIKVNISKWLTKEFRRKSQNHQNFNFKTFSVIVPISSHSAICTRKSYVGYKIEYESISWLSLSIFVCLQLCTLTFR